MARTFPAVVLFEPEIPPNTGNIGRLCLSVGSPLHLVGPLGFSLDARALRRAGLDYWKEVDLHRWEEWGPFASAARAEDASSRFFFFSTRARRPYWDVTFRGSDYLVFGPETRGLPAALMEAAPASRLLTIPMPGPRARSLNLATSAGVALFEAVRQISTNRP